MAAAAFIERGNQRHHRMVARSTGLIEAPMSPSPGWHPLVVHFPIALVVVAAALLLAARLLRSETLASTAATVGTWNLCLGAVAAVLALGSGLGAVLDLDVSAAARAAISQHMKWAMFTTLVLVLLAVWRGAGTAAGSRPSWVFIVVLLAATAALGRAIDGRSPQSRDGNHICRPPIVRNITNAGGSAALWCAGYLTERL